MLLDVRERRATIFLDDVGDDASIDIPEMFGMALRQLVGDALGRRVARQQAARLSLPLTLIRQLAEQRPVEVVVPTLTRRLAQLFVALLLTPAVLCMLAHE